MTDQEFLVAVIGAGPAGLFAARQLANRGVRVVLFNRDIKPGGLAEYGIYHDKIKMKDGLRKQFGQILELPLIQYYGNVVVGEQGELTLDDLRNFGFHALLVTAGAQGTKWLGLPGEDLTGVYHAKDLVYHYNKLPPYSQQQFHIGQKAALVGVGNVMMDIAHWLVRDLHIQQLIGVARRGPAEVKFTKKEMEAVGANLDISSLERELERARPVMEALGQDVAAARDFILAGTAKALPAISESQLRFEFLASPVRILGDASGRVCGLEVEDTTLIGSPENPKTRSLGTYRTLDVDTVVFCIGDKVDETFGLPVKWNAYVKNPNPVYAVGGLSYEAYDPDREAPLDGIFVAGWSREASSGLVGVARKDGENGAQAVLSYLEQRSGQSSAQDAIQQLDAHLRQKGCRVITQRDLKLLETAERLQAEQRSQEEFKFSSNEEMLAVMGTRETWIHRGGR